MPMIHHGRYRGGNEHVRYSPGAVQAYTDANHSRFYNGRIGESLAALAKSNAPKSAKSNAPKSVESDPRPAIVAEFSQAEMARLMGMTVKALRDEARRALIDGRSRMRKAELVERLHGEIVIAFESDLY